MIAIWLFVSTIADRQRFHHHLGSSAIQRSNQRQGKHAIPELHHRSGEFQHLFLLAGNSLFAESDRGIDRHHRELVEKIARRPDLGDQVRGIGLQRFAQGIEDRQLKRKHEHRRLSLREPAFHAGFCDILQEPLVAVKASD